MTGNYAAYWSLDDVNFFPFSGAYRLGGRPLSIEESAIILETDSGVRFVYPEYQRKTFELIFTASQSQIMDDHLYIQETCGANVPFYISLDNVVTSVKVYKEPGFDPQETGQKNKSNEPMFDYTLRLTECLA